jgi:hypothetical protein
MTRRGLLRMGLSGLFIIGLVLESEVGAIASDPSTQSCVVFLQATGPANSAGEILASPVDRGCYSTTAEALAASGGSLQSTPAAPTSTVVIGIEWDNTGFTGSNVIYEVASTCTASQSWVLNYVGDTWNDRFESGKGYGGCNHNKKFENADFGGAVLTCTPNCNGYGVLNNEVSSLKWLH